MTEKCAQLHIAGAAASYEPVQNSVNLTGIILCCSTGGGTIEVTNRETTPKHLMAPFSIAPHPDGGPQDYFPEKPLPMNGGIKITVSGGTPVIDAWIWYQTNQ